MGLIEFIVFVAIVGMIVYLVVTLIPMPAPFKTIIIAVACLVILLLLLRIVGFDTPIPRIRGG